MNNLLQKIRAASGHVAFYYRPLDGGCAQMYNEMMPVVAASVIKIPIMVEAFRQFEVGELNPRQTYRIKAEDKMPSCGALNRMHDGLEVTMRDLVELMIVLSDNTATNILIDILGIARVNATLEAEGLKVTRLRRKLFDKAGMEAGLSNHVCAREIGLLLERMYASTLVSPEASAQMLEILRNQKLNGKMPFFLKPRGIACAHKTGEDDGITHDVGVVYAKNPFVLCMLSEETDVPGFERLIQDVARELAAMNS